MTNFYSIYSIEDTYFLFDLEEEVTCIIYKRDRPYCHYINNSLVFRDNGTFILNMSCDNVISVCKMMRDCLNPELSNPKNRTPKIDLADYTIRIYKFQKDPHDVDIDTYQIEISIFGKFTYNCNLQQSAYIKFIDYLESRARKFLSPDPCAPLAGG